MKLTSKQLEVIADKVMTEWKKSGLVQIKTDDKVVREKILSVLHADYQKELDLEKEVNAMIEKLERSNPGEFERYKMYPLLKQKLAKEKKVVL